MIAGWEVPKNRGLNSLDAHPLIEGVLAVGYTEGTIEWRSGPKDKPFRKVGSTGGAKVECVRWAPKQALVLACHFAELASVFERLSSGVWRSIVLRGHELDVSGLTWSSDGSKLATCSLDNKTIVWDYAQSRQLQVISASGWVRACGLDPGNRYLATCVEENLVVWRVADGGEHSRVRVSERTGAKAVSVDWSPDGRFVCVGSSDGRVLLVDRHDTKSPISLEGFGSDPIAHVRFFDSLIRTQQGSLAGLLAISSQNSTAVFLSVESVAIDTVDCKGGTDLAWTAGASLVYVSDNTVQERAIGLPEGAVLLDRGELTTILASTYRGQEMASQRNGSGGSGLVESVVQLDMADLARKGRTSPRKTTNRVQAATTTENAPPVDVALHKTGKKRVQLTNLTGVDKESTVTPMLTPSASAALPSTIEGAVPLSRKAALTDQPIPPVTSLVEGQRKPAPAHPINNSSITHTTTTTNGTSATEIPPPVDEDCGNCKYCMDKPKFGGRNVYKQRCLARGPSQTSSKRSKSTLLAESKVATNELSEEEDDHISSSEAEPDSDNELAGYVLAPLRLCADGLHGKPRGQQSVSSTLPGNRALSLAYEGDRLRSVLKCYDRRSSERLWTYQTRGRVEGIASSDNFLCIVSDLDELHLLHMASGVPTQSPIALESSCALLQLREGSKLLVATRDGYLSVLNLDTRRFVMRKVLLYPLINMHGKPFSISSNSLNASRNVSLELIAPADIPVLMITTTKNLKIGRGQSSAVAFAFDAEQNIWTKILDPITFLGSEFCTLRPTVMGQGGGVLACLERKLITSLAAAIPATQAVSILAQNSPSVQVTVLHIESLVHAALSIKSNDDVLMWLRRLFERLATDYAVFHRKTREWLNIAHSDPKLKQHVVTELLPLLSRSIDYQNLLELWVERCRI